MSIAVGVESVNNAEDISCSNKAVIVDVQRLEGVVPGALGFDMEVNPRDVAIGGPIVDDVGKEVTAVKPLVELVGKRAVCLGGQLSISRAVINPKGERIIVHVRTECDQAVLLVDGGGGVLGRCEAGILGHRDIVDGGDVDGKGLAEGGVIGSAYKVPVLAPVGDRNSDDC